MGLRKEIIELIEESCPGIHNGDTDLAAKKVLKRLDNHLGLLDNGWFDDDDDMVAFLYE